MAARTGVHSIRQTTRLRDAAPAKARPVTRHEVVDAMAEMLSLEKPASAAEALKWLRHAYPDYPLALRLAGLAAAMRRTPPDPDGIYIPR